MLHADHERVARRNSSRAKRRICRLRELHRDGRIPANAGNFGAVIVTRDIDAERTEIVTLSWWKDEDSIKAFAGSDISCAHYYPEDDRFLLTRPQTVQHYDCSSSAGLFG
jgi:heme-degrading monooxygenase HmoA